MPTVKNSDLLAAFYDLNVSPMSFDYFTFLALADLERRKQHKTSIHIVIVPNFGDGFLDWKGVDVGYDFSQKKWRLFNMIIQASWLVPAVVQLSLCNSREEASDIYSKYSGAIFPEGHSMEKPVMGWDKGLASWYGYKDQDLQCLSASAPSKEIMSTWLKTRVNGRKIVTLTLREASYFPARNSDLKEWGNFARSLEAGGYFPIVIRDAEKITEETPKELDGITQFPEAVFNMELRIALYELSYICMFVSNGPAEIGFYNKNISYLYFVTGNWLTERPTPFEGQGIAFGYTPSFATAYQKWIWKAANEANLQSEFDRLENELSSALSDGTFIRGLTRQPGNQVSHIELAEGFLRSGRFDNTIIVCDSIINEEPSNGQAYLLKAKAMIRHENIFDQVVVEKNLLEAKKYGASRLDVKAEHGKFLMHLHLWRDALAIYDQLQQENPTDLYILLQKAIIFDELGRHQEAIDCYQGLRDSGQNHRNIIYRIIENLKAMGRIKEAAALGLEWHQMTDSTEHPPQEPV